MSAHRILARLVSISIVSLAVIVGWCASLIAGPPFVTDDVYLLPYHSGEYYLFATGSHASGETFFGAAPGIEMDYSFIRRTFFHIVVPLAISRPSLGPAAHGIGDVEVGVCWQFIKQTAHRPLIGTLPRLELPTGDEKRGLGNGQFQALLPLWLGKDIGHWTSYGGGGYWINPGSGHRNWWFTGLVVQRQLTGSLYLGGEIYHQTADVDGGVASTGFNVGGGLTITGSHQIMFSAGRNIQDENANWFSFYLAIYGTF